MLFTEQKAKMKYNIFIHQLLSTEPLKMNTYHIKPFPVILWVFHSEELCRSVETLFFIFNAVLTLFKRIASI